MILHRDASFFLSKKEFLYFVGPYFCTFCYFLPIFGHYSLTSHTFSYFLTNVTGIPVLYMCNQFWTPCIHYSLFSKVISLNQTMILLFLMCYIVLPGWEYTASSTVESQSDLRVAPFSKEAQGSCTSRASARRDHSGGREHGCMLDTIRLLDSIYYPSSGDSEQLCPV